MKRLALVGLLLINSQMAMAVNWFLSSAKSVEHNETTHIDFDSIKGYYFNHYDKSSYYVMAWVKKDYPTAQKLRDGRLYRQEKALWYVDCLSQKYAVGDVALYASAGKLVHSSQNSYVSTYSSSNWYRVVPDSVGGATVQDICLMYSVKFSYVPPTK